MPNTVEHTSLQPLFLVDSSLKQKPQANISSKKDCIYCLPVMMGKMPVAVTETLDSWDCVATLTSCFYCPRKTTERALDFK